MFWQRCLNSCMVLLGAFASACQTFIFSTAQLLGPSTARWGSCQGRRQVQQVSTKAIDLLAHHVVVHDISVALTVTFQGAAQVARKAREWAELSHR